MVQKKHANDRFHFSHLANCFSYFCHSDTDTKIVKSLKRPIVIRNQQNKKKCLKKNVWIY